MNTITKKIYTEKRGGDEAVKWTCQWEVRHTMGMTIMIAKFVVASESVDVYYNNISVQSRIRLERIQFSWVVVDALVFVFTNNFCNTTYFTYGTSQSENQVFPLSRLKRCRDLAFGIGCYAPFELTLDL